MGYVEEPGTNGAGGRLRVGAMKSRRGSSVSGGNIRAAEVVIRVALAKLPVLVGVTVLYTHLFTRFRSESYLSVAALINVGLKELSFMGEFLFAVTHKVPGSTTTETCRLVAP